MYKKYIGLTFLIITLVIFQTSFFSVFFTDGLNPALVISLIFAFFLLDRTNYALFSALVGGLTLDLLGFSLVGSSPLIFVSLVFASLLVRKYILKNLFSQSVLCVISFLIYTSIITYPNKLDFVTVIWGAILTLLCSYLISYLLSNLINERKYL